MRKFINRVTVTGADDSTNVMDLFEIQKQYPFVEFGILLSERYSLKDGVSRFPSKRWIEHLLNVCESNQQTKLTLSGHICGKWVKQSLLGDFPDFSGMFNKTTPFTKFFNRYQLNTHAEYHDVNYGRLEMILGDLINKNQTMIFQLDGVNEILSALMHRGHRNISGLFDLSHGAGILPSDWPKAFSNDWFGYAGGLSAENVVEQIEKISQVVEDGRLVWIDAETQLRSPDNRVFDLDKVVKFLENSKPYIV